MNDDNICRKSNRKSMINWKMVRIYSQTMTENFSKARKFISFEKLFFSRLHLYKNVSIKETETLLC